MTMDANRERAIDLAVSQIEKQFGKGAIMKLGEDALVRDVAVALDRLARARHRARRRRHAARARRRDLRTGVVGQDDAGAAARRRGAEERRHLRLHRRRARARRRLRAQARRAHRGPAHLAARPRRAGARDRRHAGALGGDRRARGRLGRGARAARRDRGRHGRPADGPPGAPHVAGAAQAHRHDRQVADDRRLHQPDPHEDRRDVRQPRDHDRRQRAQVLRLGAPRHPPHRRHQARRRGDRQPHQGEGREEQGGAARSARSSSTSSTAGHLQGRRAVDLGAECGIIEKSGRVVLLRGRAHRSGARERARTTCTSTPTLRGRDRGARCARSTASRRRSRREPAMAEVDEAAEPRGEGAERRTQSGPERSSTKRSFAEHPTSI